MPGGVLLEDRGLGTAHCSSFPRSLWGARHSTSPAPSTTCCPSSRTRLLLWHVDSVSSSQWHLFLFLLPACFYRAAFFCHFWLGGKLCLNKQEGGLFGSSPSPLSFPLVFWLFLPSLFIPLGAQTLAELLRLQRGRGCSSRSHAFTFHFVEREKEQMLVQGSCLGLGMGLLVQMQSQTHAGPCCLTMEKSVSITEGTIQDRPGHWEEVHSGHISFAFNPCMEHLSFREFRFWMLKRENDVWLLSNSSKALSPHTEKLGTEGEKGITASALTWWKRRVLILLCSPSAHGAALCLMQAIL